MQKSFSEREDPSLKLHHLLIQLLQSELFSVSGLANMMPEHERNHAQQSAVHPAYVPVQDSVRLRVVYVRMPSSKANMTLAVKSEILVAQIDLLSGNRDTSNLPT